MQLTQASSEDLGHIVDLVNQAYRGAAAPGWTSEAELISGARIDLGTLTATAGGPTIILVAKQADAERLGCVALAPADGGQWYFEAFPYHAPSVGTPLRDDLALATLTKPLV